MIRKRSRKHKKRATSTRRQQKSSRRRAAPPPSRDERVLRQRILRFTYQDRFKADFEPAIHLYFGEEALQDDVLTIDEGDAPGFQEWYVHDYVTSEERRIIDLFAEKVGPRLALAQRQMLDDWRRTNRYRLLEVQAVEPGVGVTVRDLLGGEEFEVNDISSSHALVKWQVLLARPLLTKGRLHFTGAVIPLPPIEKPDLLSFAQDLWKEYQAQYPQASLDDFYRDRGLDLYHRVIEIATAPPPPVYTPEGHPLMACEAHYTLTDPRAVEEWLDQAEEFIYVGPADEDGTALAYVWLLTGRSHVPEIPIEGRGLMMQTDWVSDSGEITHRSLGDVRLWRDRMELSCLSLERLAAGKPLLKQTLGRLIQHQGDEFRDLETMLESAETAPPSPQREPLSEVEETISLQMMAAQHKKWLDESIPALDGRSPREAAGDPAMREQLEELLKVIEYMEEQRRRAGEPHIDIADLRRDLGLPPR